MSKTRNLSWEGTQNVVALALNNDGLMNVIENGHHWPCAFLVGFCVKLSSHLSSKEFLDTFWGQTPFNKKRLQLVSWWGRPVVSTSKFFARNFSFLRVRGEQMLIIFNEKGMQMGQHIVRPPLPDCRIIELSKLG